MKSVRNIVLAVIMINISAVIISSDATLTQTVTTSNNSNSTQIANLVTQNNDLLSSLQSLISSISLLASRANNSNNGSKIRIRYNNAVDKNNKIVQNNTKIGELATAINNVNIAQITQLLTQNIQLQKSIIPIAYHLSHSDLKDADRRNSLFKSYSTNYSKQSTDCNFSCCIDYNFLN